jgi:nucleoside-diphosphate-sugar epimerase
MNRYQNTVIIGCGDIGKRIAILLQKDNNSVFGVVRSNEGLRALQRNNIQGINIDLDTVETFESLPVNNALVYYLVPPPRQGVTDTRIRRFLDMITNDASPKKIVYMSTSGVYGDVRGDWVTENSPVDPGSDRGKRRLDAENAVRAWSKNQNTEYVILRVPGIYGPGRIQIDRLKNRNPVLRKEDAPYSNRIHADDLTNICVAAAKTSLSNSIFNASDGQPSTITEYYNTMAKLLGLRPPPTITMREASKIMSPMRLSFLQESKRLDNSKMLTELNVDLLYPDMETGLRATFLEMDLISE